MTRDDATLRCLSSCARACRGNKRMRHHASYASPAVPSVIQRWSKPNALKTSFALGAVRFEAAALEIVREALAGAGRVAGGLGVLIPRQIQDRAPGALVLVP